MINDPEFIDGKEYEVGDRVNITNVDLLSSIEDARNVQTVSEVSNVKVTQGGKWFIAQAIYLEGLPYIYNQSDIEPV